MTTIVKQLNQEIDSLRKHNAELNSQLKGNDFWRKEAEALAQRCGDRNVEIQKLEAKITWLTNTNSELGDEIKVLTNSRESWIDDALRYRKNAEYWQDMHQKAEFDKLQSPPQSQEEVAEQVMHAGFDKAVAGEEHKEALAEFNYVVPVPSLGVYVHINLTPIQEALNDQVK